MEPLAALRDGARRAHGGALEILALASLYGVYELVRGLRSVDLASANEHAHQIVRLERNLGVFSEPAVQRFCTTPSPPCRACTSGTRCSSAGR